MGKTELPPVINQQPFGFNPANYPPIGSDMTNYSDLPPNYTDLHPDYTDQPPVINQQPFGFNPANYPPVGGWNCTPGLEPLLQANHLVIHRDTDCLEVFLGLPHSEAMGQLLYIAEKDSDCCPTNTLDAGRQFDMEFKDTTGREIIHLQRPGEDCCGSCIPNYKMEIMAPPGCLAGTAEKDPGIFSNTILVSNAAGDVVFHLSPTTWSFNNDVKFKVKAGNKDIEIGRMKKESIGWLNIDYNLRITFPLDLDVNMKAVLLGACVLGDYLFYELPRRQRS